MNKILLNTLYTNLEPFAFVSLDHGKLPSLSLTHLYHHAQQLRVIMDTPPPEIFTMGVIESKSYHTCPGSVARCIS
jgi:hypothetical protein